MTYTTIKIAGKDALFNTENYAFGSSLSCSDLSSEAKTIFNYFNESDNGILDGYKTLSIMEIGSVVRDIVKYSGKDGILSDSEIKELLYSRGVSNINTERINAAKDFFLAISKKSNNQALSGSSWDNQSKNLRTIDKNLTFNLDGENTSVTITNIGNGKYFIDETSIMGDKVKFLNRDPIKFGEDNKMILENGDELVVGDQVWIYNDGKLENTGLDKGTYKMLFPKGIDGDNLKQGHIGDCYLVATLSEIADNPEGKLALARLFYAPDGKNGDIYVRFPGAEGKPIKISKKEIAKMNNVGLVNKITNLFDSDEHLEGNLGFKILEKAYGQLLSAKENNTQNDNEVPLNSSKAIDSIDDGGFMRDVLTTFLGEEAETIYSGDSKLSLQDKQAEVIKLLNAAAKNPDDYLLTVSTLSAANKSDDDMYKAGNSNVKLAHQHAYSISKIDAKNKKVYLVNPWNTSKEICLSYDDFIKSFSDIEYEKLS